MRRITVLTTGASIAALFGAVLALAAPQSQPSFDATIRRHAQTLLDEGRKIFRYDTFGSEAFWGGQLELHKAIAGEKNGGVGPGVSPKTRSRSGSKSTPMRCRLR